jgi:ribose 5-phosphate isomerase B
VRIAVAVDHAGFPLKAAITAALERDGHDVVDCGTDSEQSVDYPLYAARAARMVSEGAAERAVLACGSGTGVCIVANKVDGVRAVNARDRAEVEMARLHNDVNVLALAGRSLEENTARTIVETFLHTEFEGGRHQRRVDQISQIEAGTLEDRPEMQTVEDTR